MLQRRPMKTIVKMPKDAGGRYLFFLFLNSSAKKRYRRSIAPPGKASYKAAVRHLVYKLKVIREQVVLKLPSWNTA